VANRHTKLDLAIVTVIPEEYHAVRRRVVNPYQASFSRSEANVYAWELGEVPTRSGEAYKVVVGMIGIGGTNSTAMATVDAVSRWQPRYVLLVGIAGGFPLDGLKKGDVVVADVVYGYEYGKLEKEFNPRMDRTFQADLGLVNGTMALSRFGTNWIERIDVKPPIPGIPNVFKGAVASGDKVVDDPTNEFFEKVHKAWPKLQAVEMEGAGAAAAIEYTRALGLSVGFLMIRGISDMPRPKQEAEHGGDTKAPAKGTQERDAWKIYASNVAAAFTIAYVANGLPTPPGSDRDDESTNRRIEGAKDMTARRKRRPQTVINIPQVNTDEFIVQKIVHGHEVKGDYIEGNQTKIEQSGDQLVAHIGGEAQVGRSLTLQEATPYYQPVFDALVTSNRSADDIADLRHLMRELQVEVAQGEMARKAILAELMRGLAAKAPDLIDPLLKALKVVALPVLYAVAQTAIQHFH
jgi:nucleoside phosphorylase